MAVTTSASSTDSLVPPSNVTISAVTSTSSICVVAEYETFRQNIMTTVPLYDTASSITGWTESTFELPYVSTICLQSSEVSSVSYYSTGSSSYGLFYITQQIDVTHITKVTESVTSTSTSTSTDTSYITPGTSEVFTGEGSSSNAMPGVSVTQQVSQETESTMGRSETTKIPDTAYSSTVVSGSVSSFTAPLGTTKVVGSSTISVAGLSSIFTEPSSPRTTISPFSSAAQQTGNGSDTNHGNPPQIQILAGGAPSKYGVHYFLMMTSFITVVLFA